MCLHTAAAASPGEQSLSSMPNSGLAPVLLLPPAKAIESSLHGEIRPKAAGGCACSRAAQAALTL